MAFEYIGIAFATALQPFNILVMFLSTLVGLVMGVLPGLSATMAIALLTGLTYNFPTQTAILSLLSIYVGSISGGCQSAILLNIPGTPASAATALDGHPMAQQGKGGLAIFLAALFFYLRSGKWWKNLLIAILGVIAIVIVFQYCFNAALP